MLIAASYDTFLGAPTGRYTVTGSSLVWCASRSLCGSVMWGRQPEAETAAILRIFDQYPRHMDGVFDIVLDTRGVDEVDPASLQALFSWLLRNRRGLAPRIRLQASIIREGPIGFLLTGLLPVAGRTHPYRVFTLPAEAFAAVGDVDGALCAAVESVTEATRGVPHEVQVTRDLLAERIDTTMEDASAALRTSPRSLQRVLTRHGTSFHQEVKAARLTLAKEILRSSDVKVAVVGARVGISERALTLLFRAETGLAPAEWRKHHR